MRWQKAEKRFEDKYIPEPNSGCWLWIGVRSDRGYGKFYFRGKRVRAHRFSWELHRGLIPENLQVLHKCDTPCCVNPDHLFLGFPRDNKLDNMKKNRHACGEKIGQAKLTNNQIKAIRTLLLVGIIQQKIADIFGVDQSTISYIKTGHTWKHLREANNE